MKAIITTSWDDGHPLDLKLAELLRKYGIPATFYIPLDYRGERLTSASQVREIAMDLDIGGHTYHHVNLTSVSEQEALQEISDGKKRLEDIVDRKLLSFCYPYGYTNSRVSAIVKEAGFLGARTTGLLSRRIQDPFTIKTTVYAARQWPTHLFKESFFARDRRFFYFVVKNGLFLQPWHRIALETLKFVVENGGVWHMWGHSWEIDENDDWAHLESVLREISMLTGTTQRVDNSRLLESCIT
jgi:peptidoglycan/xylan/chitin deacetylase (PgdA/CDA1 family)